MILIGFLSSPFGLKGDIKLLSNELHLEKILKVGTKVYIDNNEYIISNYKEHNKNIYIRFENYEHINKIDNLLKKDLYIDDIILDDNEYLLSDLENASVYYNDKLLGNVSEVLLSKINLIRVENKLIPLDEHFLKKVDRKNKKVYVNFMEELDEN